MKYRVQHLTQYEYGHKVSACYNCAHLLPRETHYQLVDDPRIVTYPVPSTSSRRVDYFGNHVYHFSVQESHNSLSIQVTTNITLKQQGSGFGVQLGYGNTCAQVRDMLHDPGGTIETLYAREFLLNSPMIKVSDSLRSYAEACFPPDKPFLSAVMDLTHKIYTEFDFNADVTNVATPVEEVLAKQHGVCQDFAHVAVGCLRSMGYAARYISGYLETLPPPGKEKLVGTDASHAWFSVYSPGEGWFEFDPTNDSVPTHQHILTAWGRDYWDVSPLRGVIFGGGNNQSLTVSVDVERCEIAHEDDLST